MKSFPLVLLAAGALAGCGRLSRGGHASAAPSAPVTLSPGITFQEVKVGKFPEHPRLWVYLPSDGHKNHPCIVIAAAGSNMVTGMSLSDGDRPEHLPYVKAGYVVVAYDVSGVPGGSVGEAAAMHLFAKRDAGVANGRAAVDYALRNLPIDPMRLYSVGHSSAGTLALQLAAEDSRIRGCIAYAPVTNVPEHLGAAMGQISTMPDVDRAVRKFSPLANVEKVRCPVMLFTAQDDSTVPSATVERYALALSKQNKDVTVERASSGGHYNSMIAAGIPAGLQWLGRSRRPKK